jgi:hypothetical protein
MKRPLRDAETSDRGCWVPCLLETVCPGDERGSPTENIELPTGVPSSADVAEERWLCGYPRRCPPACRTLTVLPQARARYLPWHRFPSFPATTAAPATRGPAPPAPPTRPPTPPSNRIGSPSGGPRLGPTGPTTTRAPGQVGRVPSRGDGDAACPVRRVRGPGLQPRRAHHDLTRRVSPWVPGYEPILPDGRALSSF